MEKPKVLRKDFLENQKARAKSNETYLKARLKELETENPNTYLEDEDYSHCQQRLSKVATQLQEINNNLRLLKQKVYANL